MKEGIAEALKRVSEIKNKEEKIKEIRRLWVALSPLRIVVEVCFHPKIEWILPDGAPPYKKMPKEMDAQVQLYNRIKKIGMFFDRSFYPDMKNAQREGLYIQFLESLDPDDAELMLAIKDRKIPYKGMTKKFFQEAFPDITKHWDEENGQNVS